MEVPRLQIDDTSEWLDIGLDAGDQGGVLFVTEQGRSGFSTSLGELECDVSREALPDVDGLLVRRHGLRGRTIEWSGLLRLSAGALVDLLRQRDRFCATDSELTFIDWTGETYEHCDLVSFGITNRRRIQADGDIEWVADYRIELKQLAVTSSEDTGDEGV